LEHQVAGAIGIAQYFLPQPPSGVTIDQNTGTVTIDGPSLRQAMMQYLVASFKAAESSGKANASPPAKLLQAKLAELNPTIIKCAQHLQRRMDGYPMLVPIYIRATDAEGHVAELQYYLLDTISLQQILQQISNTP